MQRKKAIFCGLAVLALAACGGGGHGDGGGGGNSLPAAPSGLAYTATAQNYTVGTAIAALHPTVTGTVTNYAISPTLPAGISIDTTTGVISGTPTAAQTATPHTISASNAGGSTTATISVTVIDVAPSIGYPRPSYSFTTGNAISPVTPTSTAGAVVTWWIDQPLPDGLSFSATTGEITGTPLAESPTTTYRVTGVNSGGSHFVDITIGVQSGVVLELGHDAEIARIVYTGARVLSIDTRGRTRLFDAQTGATLVRSEPGCDGSCGDIAQIAGNVLVVRRLEGFHVYDATTGDRIAIIDHPTPSYTGYWDLATDGSYVVDRRIDGIAAWTTDGTPLFARTSGNYAGALTFAAAGEYRIANGPLGAQVVEYIAIPSGAVRQTGTLIGTFHSWFADGQRFLTRSGAVAVVYSHQAVQQWTLNLANFEGLAGLGNWIWTKNSYGQTDVYAVGGSDSPVASFNIGSTWPGTLVPHGDRLVASSGVVIDLSGSTPTSAQLDTTSTPYPSAFGVQSTSDWVIGDRSGVVIARPTGPRSLRLSRGRAYSIVGGDTRFALAFASGELLYFDASTRALEGSIDFPAYKLALSRDGQTLAASGGGYGDFFSPRSLRLYSLPAETVIAEWPPGESHIEDFALSDDGNLIGQQYGIHRRVVRRDGSVVLAESGAASPVRLSPSGNRVAIPAQSRQDVAYSHNATSNVYTNGVLSASVSGWAVGWIDESRLLVNRYRRYRSTDPYGVYDGAFIVDPNGVDIGAPTLPAIYEFQRLNDSQIYNAEANSIFEASTGAPLWYSPLGGSPANPVPVGAVAGDYVVYAAGAFIRAEPR